MKSLLAHLTKRGKLSVNPMTRGEQHREQQLALVLVVHVVHADRWPAQHMHLEVRHHGLHRVLRHNALRQILFPEQ